MNAKLLVKISNSIGLISIILLIYWVFTFVLIQVFGLKIFRQHLTESFLMSIHGKHLNFFNEHRIDYFDKEMF